MGPVPRVDPFATVDGAADLDAAVVRAWAVPAARWLRPLLDWSDPQTVYVTSGKLWFFVSLAATLAAFAVHRLRAAAIQVGGAERVGLWLALTGHAFGTVGAFGDYWTPWIDESFAYVGIPSTLLSVVGSIVLGVALLRRRSSPAATPWLLLLWLPLFVLLSTVIAMGAAMLPFLWAWGLAGRRLYEPDRVAVPA